ncbi:MAG: GntR family transcriptional regulator [Armatimonadota bacterium]
MILKVDTTRSTPIYAQIVEQIKRAIASGVLKAGDPLPSLRETAVGLRVNPLTVDKAYKQLEREELIETRHGLGSFIAASSRIIADGFRKQVLQQSIDNLLTDAQHLGISCEELKEMLDDRAKVLKDEFSRDGFERRDGKDGR